MIYLFSLLCFIVLIFILDKLNSSFEDENCDCSCYIDREDLELQKSKMCERNKK